MKKTKRRRHASPAAVAVKEAGEPQPCPEAMPARDRRAWLVTVPLVLLVAAAFLPILRNGFVDWDDGVNFTGNRHYQGLGWPHLRWAWTTFLLGVYQPLGWMILEVQHALCGLDPRGYHLASLLMHIANVLALFALTMALLVRARPDLFLHDPWACALGAGLAAALFAVHPLRVEPVAWASCQTYLPCALFALLAALAYLRAVGSGPSTRRGWLAGSLALFVAAMLCKAAAVTLPAVLLILDVYPLRRLGGGPGRWLGPSARKVWLEKVPFVAMSLVFMAIAVAAKTEVHTLVPLENDGVLARIAQACYGAWFYLVKTVIPRDISVFYSLPARIDWSAPPFLLSILATLAVSVGLFLLRRRWPGLLAAWLCYLVILAPSSGLVRIGNHLAADRYSYLPLLGGVVPLAAALGLPWAAWRRARAVPVIAATGAAVLLLVVLTRDQCRIWRTSETLWSHAMDHGGGSRAHRGMGSVFFHQGRLEEAEAEFEQTIRLAPQFAAGYCGLASVRSLQGRFEEAGADFEQAARLDPNDAETHYGLAWVRSRQGRFAEAIAHFDRAVQLDPDYTEAHNERAMILATCPDPRYRDGKEAVASATRACELTGWDQPSCLDTLAAASAEAGDFDAAAAWQEKAIGLLHDERRKDDYRSRLALYRARKPFRAESNATGAGR